MINKPMLAPVEPINLEEELVDGELYAVQPKYDGIRLKFTSGVPYTRSGKLLPNKQVADSLTAIYNRSALRGMDIDGELLMFNAETDWFYPFNVVQSVMMSSRPADLTALQDWVYMVFDWDDRNKCQEFQDRYYCLMQVFKGTPQNKIENRIWLSATHFSSDKADVIISANQVIAHGFEGAMIRRCKGRWYKYGRVTRSEGHIRKYVEWVRDEAEITDVIQLARNLDTSCRLKENMVPVEMMGALMVRHPRFGEFAVGSGFDDNQRRNMWVARASLRGRRITFKYKPGHIKDAPCPAIFVGFREGGEEE